MSRRIDETTIPFLKAKGYGKGTNYTTDLVASLILQYADALVKTLTIPVVIESVCEHEWEQKEDVYTNYYHECKKCHKLR